MIILVDFENTHASGLAGYEYLNETDTVVMYYSDENSAVTRGVVEDLKSRNVHVTLVKLLKQHSNALDMYIASTTGMFLDSGEKICIVSKDRGYAAVRDFWHSLRNAEILLGETIEECFLNSVANDEERIRNVKERNRKTLLTNAFETMNKIPTRPTLNRYGYFRRRRNPLDITKNLDPVEILPNPLWNPNLQDNSELENDDSGKEENPDLNPEMNPEILGVSSDDSERPVNVNNDDNTYNTNSSATVPNSGKSSKNSKSNSNSRSRKQSKVTENPETETGNDTSALGERNDNNVNEKNGREDNNGSNNVEDGRDRDLKNKTGRGKRGRKGSEVQTQTVQTIDVSDSPKADEVKNTPGRKRSIELFSNAGADLSVNDVSGVQRVIPRINPNQVQYVYDTTTGQMRKVSFSIESTVSETETSVTAASSEKSVTAVSSKTSVAVASSETSVAVVTSSLTSEEAVSTESENGLSRAEDQTVNLFESAGNLESADNQLDNPTVNPDIAENLAIKLEEKAENGFERDFEEQSGNNNKLEEESKDQADNQNKQGEESEAQADNYYQYYHLDQLEENQEDNQEEENQPADKQYQEEKEEKSESRADNQESERKSGGLLEEKSEDQSGSQGETVSENGTVDAFTESFGEIINDEADEKSSKKRGRRGSKNSKAVIEVNPTNNTELNEINTNNIQEIIERYGKTSNTLHQYYLKIMKVYGKAAGKPIYDSTKKAVQMEMKHRKLERDSSVKDKIEESVNE